MGFWEVEPGEKVADSWFKTHPKVTLCILLGLAGIIVLISI